MLRQLISATDAEAFRIGLVATTFGFGLRHGIDWDHIAAITDITTSQETGRVSMLFATLYALGHALVVFVLGVAAITLGDLLPSSVDSMMERIVGVTLILLGVYVFFALIRDRRDFRMRSRWMLIFAGVRAGSRWVRSRVGSAPSRPALEPLEHQHEHVSGTPHHSAVESPKQAAATLTAGPHEHLHHHVGAKESDAFMNYGKGTSFVVGMIHGVGAETPTQILIFLAAAGGGGVTGGVLLLFVFLAGLFASNSIIALASTYGFLAAGRSFRVYATVAVLTGTFSLVIGMLFVVGKGTFLPAIFGG